MSDQITITLPQGEAQALIAELDSSGVKTEQVTSARQTGQDLFITVFLPTALTAVQVAATFIAARKAKSKPPAPSEPTTPHPTQTRIRIGSLTIGDAQFSVEAVERQLGRPLDDA